VIGSWDGAVIDLNADVACPRLSEITDDGHQLMMFCASPRFFDAVGECDERFLGANYDDCDWGIRALLAGKKNLQSTGALVGHIAGFTFFGPAVLSSLGLNDRIFIDKWGQAVWDEMQTGSLWTRLHREHG
jgi:hypothetical protein